MTFADKLARLALHVCGAGLVLSASSAVPASAAAQAAPEHAALVHAAALHAEDPPAPASETSSSAPAVEWIREHAQRIEPAALETPGAELAPLMEIVGDARLVALGEPASGTHEGFAIKRRLFEQLVAEHGFRVLALDIGWLEARALDEYVTAGAGTAQAALIGLERLDWACREALELVEWMRAWNADPEHAAKLRVEGLDVQRTRMAAEHLLAFLRKVDPDRAAHVSVFVAPYRLVDPNGMPNFTGVSDDFAAAITYALADLLTVLSEHQADYVKASTPAEWLDALRCAASIAQADELRHAKDADARELALAGMLAENVRSTVERAGDDARIVLWTVNAHVDRERTVGRQLDALLAQRWRALALTFERGERRGVESVPKPEARDLPPKQLGVRFVRCTDPPDDSIEAVLARTELPLALLDLRKLPEPGPAADWFARPHPLRSRVTAIPGIEVGTFETMVPARSFDALIFVKTVTPVRGMQLSASR